MEPREVLHMLHNEGRRVYTCFNDELPKHTKSIMARGHKRTHLEKKLQEKSSICGVLSAPVPAADGDSDQRLAECSRRCRVARQCGRKTAL